MAQREILLPWDSQPQEVAEICRDYSPAFIYNPAIGLLVPALGEALSPTGTVTAGVGVHGKAVSLAALAYLTRANYAPIVTSNGSWTGDFTALVIANPSTGNVRALFGQRSGSGSFSQFGIQANANATGGSESGRLQFYTYSSDYTSTDFAGGGAIDGRYHVYGIRRIVTTLTGWIDGVQVASVTGTARAIGDASAGLGIGVAPPTFNTNNPVDVAFAGGFNTGILDMAEVSHNVWRAAFAPQSIWIPVSAGGGPTPVNGTLTGTIADATSTATATLALAGTLTSTLGALTSAATGTLAITGTASATLADASLSAAGELQATGSGTVNATLDAATLSSAGALAITGAVTQTLADATLAATATLPLTGAVSQTLAALTSDATGTLPIVGAVSSTLGALALESTGTSQDVTTGTLSSTLADATLASAGTALLRGSASITLGDCTIVATATMPLAGISGVAEQTLGALTSAATGTLAITGSLSATLANCTAVAAGGDPSLVTSSEWWRYEVAVQDLRFQVAAQDLTFTIER